MHHTEHIVLGQSSGLALDVIVGACLLALVNKHDLPFTYTLSEQITISTCLITKIKSQIYFLICHTNIYIKHIIYFIG